MVIYYSSFNFIDKGGKKNMKLKTTDWRCIHCGKATRCYRDRAPRLCICGSKDSFIKIAENDCEVVID